MNNERWQRLMASLRIADGTGAYDSLVVAYNEKQRHYHTAHHIDHCLREFDSCCEPANEPEEIELAIWFHDAVYDPYSSVNEERSADWACNFLLHNGVALQRVDRVRKHILATRHQVVPTDSDSRLLLDIDLAILGANNDDYSTFETNVRKEYKWVPYIVYRRKRAEILKSFLDRPQIYTTKSFLERYEQPARLNLSLAIAKLSA